jgi:precorrin-6B C5,15-methyltransferase / cobalt-precorrin-6B C5,C15-methyltransferase
VIHTIGVGLEGASGLSDRIQVLIRDSSLLVGSVRHLSYFPDYRGKRLVLEDLQMAIAHIEQGSLGDRTVILVSGDPLFFGLGRLLLAQIPAEQLTFHPHISSIQLAFNRIKIPWQDARLISAHGRSLDEAVQALQQGAEKIAILTDRDNHPAAIAQLLVALDLPSNYEFWVCENLGGDDERVAPYDLEQLLSDPPTFAPLNLVVLLRRQQPADFNWDTLPRLGLPDRSFLSFADRPGLMTKREIRILVLGELALTPNAIVWDIGAGTGSVSIEIARLFPETQLYAIEQTAMGATLIEQNCRRFRVHNIQVICSKAPAGLVQLPQPDRVFIGGSGGNLSEILTVCGDRLAPDGAIVLALATLEHLSPVLDWVKTGDWHYRLLQVQIARSVPISSLTRLSPLNPVILVTISRH